MSSTFFIIIALLANEQTNETGGFTVYPTTEVVQVQATSCEQAHKWLKIHTTKAYYIVTGCHGTTDMDMAVLSTSAGEI